jgi:enoyl-CoA hydratase/carnithine racemase
LAAIHGYCIGGGTAIGWACDIRIAADNAVFDAGDAYLGIIPSWGMGLHRLPCLLGLVARPRSACRHNDRGGPSSDTA